MTHTGRFRGSILIGLIGVVSLSGSGAEGGGRFFKRQRVAVPTARVIGPTTGSNGLAPSPMLGTFFPTPYMVVRGNGTAGGGYSPLGEFGEGNLSVYGPTSSLRATTAPVVTYSRGYDGALRPNVATSFSYPYLPAVAPVVYPTRANVADGFRQQRTPPWWDSGFNWVDLN